MVWFQCASGKLGVMFDLGVLLSAARLHPVRDSHPVLFALLSSYHRLGVVFDLGVLLSAARLHPMRGLHPTWEIGCQVRPATPCRAGGIRTQFSVPQCRFPDWVSGSPAASCRAGGIRTQFSVLRLPRPGQGRYKSP